MSVKHGEDIKNVLKNIYHKRVANNTAGKQQEDIIESMSKKLQIVYKKVGELIPYINNPRINNEAVDYVASSIREFGFKNPIIIDKNDTIVCGHTRLLSAKKLNIEEVPCIYADDLTEQQIKAFRLADNKTAELATWDLEKLDIELEGIEELEMAEFGFESFRNSLLADDFSEFTKTEENSDEFEYIEKLEKHYGVPYQGNKSRIADIIISILPSGKRLVDLFGGGGAITHCGILSDKWESHLYNDINPLITTLFMDAAHGKYHDERRVITREDFEALKDSDPYVKYIWSFGNNGTGYLWGKDIEELKQTACHALMDETLVERRIAYVHFISMLQKTNDPTPNRLAPLERLEKLKQLEALNRLEKLKQLEVSNIDYHDYKYKEGDVVYCDVPYEQIEKRGCSYYGVEFDSLEFYRWAKEQPFQIFFSSYEISDETFYKKKIKSVMSLIGANTNGQFVNEYLYSNKPIE